MWSSPYFPAFAVFGVALLLGGTFTFFTRGDDAPESFGDNSEALHVDPDSLALEPVWAYGMHSHTLLLRNASDRTVSVSRVIPSCVCMAARPGSFEIAPQSEATLALELDLSRVLDSRATPVPHPVDIGVDLLFDGGGFQTIQLTGTISPPISISPVSLTFDEPLWLGFTPGAESFTIQKNPHIVDVIVDADPRAATVSRIDESSTSRELVYEVIPATETRLGPWTFDIIVHAVTDDANRVGPYILPAQGVIEGDVDWAPKNIHLVGSESDDADHELVSFRSRSDTAFVIVELREVPEFIRADVADASIGHGTRAVQVELKGLAPGESGHGTILAAVHSPVHAQEVLVPIPVTARRLRE